MIYHCKVCGRMKLDVNGWIMAWKSANGGQFDTHWKDDMARQPEVDPVCTRGCLTIWIDRVAEAEMDNIKRVGVSRI